MRYLTKGDLLTLLGSEANAFTAFMLDPASFGVTEPVLTGLKIAKQKFDWTGGINLDLPEVVQLTDMLVASGVISASKKELLSLVVDASDLDSYIVQVLAMDEVTIQNQFGVEKYGDLWRVQVVFQNTTKGTEHAETFVFDTEPSVNFVSEKIAAQVKQLRQSRV